MGTVSLRRHADLPRERAVSEHLHPGLVLQGRELGGAQLERAFHSQRVWRLRAVRRPALDQHAVVNALSPRVAGAGPNHLGFLCFFVYDNAYGIFTCRECACSAGPCNG